MAPLAARTWPQRILTVLSPVLPTVLKQELNACTRTLNMHNVAQSPPLPLIVQSVMCNFNKLQCHCSLCWDKACAPFLGSPVTSPGVYEYRPVQLWFPSSWCNLSRWDLLLHIRGNPRIAVGSLWKKRLPPSLPACLRTKNRSMYQANRGLTALLQSQNTDTHKQESQGTKSSFS